MPEFQPCPDRYHEALAQYWRKLRARIRHKQRQAQHAHPTRQYIEDTRARERNGWQAEQRATPPNR